VDKSGEVILGYDGEKVYMVISQESLQRLNSQLLIENQKDLQTFTDSNGSFIPSENRLLSSERIEYSLEDIQMSLSDDGELSIKYLKSGNVRFEQIMLDSGNKALTNFSIIDLQNFIRRLPER
jgi:hypothetical protein